MPSPLHRLENSLRGILPVRPLRFTCVTGPGPSPSPCSSSSFSSSDGEDLRPEPAFWQSPLQQKDQPPSCKDPVRLCPVSGASPRVNSNSCSAEDRERTEPRDCSSLSAGRAEEKPHPPRREDGAERTRQPGPVTNAEGKGAAAGHPSPAPQLEEKPEPKGTEDSRDLEPGHRPPSAAGPKGSCSLETLRSHLASLPFPQLSCQNGHPLLFSHHAPVAGPCSRSCITLVLPSRTS